MTYIRSLTISSLVSLLLFGSNISGQQIIGEWKSHLSFSHARQVADAGDKVYCGTGSGLFSYHKSDHTLQVITKVEGLSDQDISTISYSGSKNILFVGYRNANIDLFDGKEIYNLPDIKRKQITGNKTIHNSMIIGEDVYLSCGFGIVVVNLEKKEIKDTYFIGENGSQSNVYDMAFDGTWLYAATESGVYRADINNPNLIDFNNWYRIPDLPYPDRSYNAVTWFAGRLYASLSNISGDADTLYYSEMGTWNRFEPVESSHLYYVGSSEDELIVITRYHVALYNAEHENIRELNLGHPNHAIVDRDGEIWMADRLAGMYWSPNTWTLDKLLPNGPLSSQVVAIAISNDLLYTVPGGVTSSWGNNYISAELNTMESSFWSGTKTLDYRDLIHISIDPSDKHHLFAASWGFGLLEYRNGELTQVYDGENSTLQTIIEGENYYRLGGTVFDRDLNLWITNSAVAEPISVRKPDGSWKSFNLNGELNANALGRIINTQNDHKWVLCHKNQGLFAFDVNGTVDNESDDQYKQFSIKDVNGKIISNEVFSFAEDKAGNIWVGTNKGIVVYYNPHRVFEDDDFYGQQVIVPRNDGSGLADILLGTEKVTAIAVDGANRKWVGTDKAGVFLLSDDGLEEIHHFTTDNSPLLSNNIMDIAIHGDNGTVYIGTESGMISYKGEAIEGKELFDDVYVYPNPVREDFEGEIVVTGLVSNVNVKITDINGNLVFETTSLGGQAIWDGRTFSGNPVRTGVYLIFCTDEDGSKTHVTKLLVIN